MSTAPKRAYSVLITNALTDERRTAYVASTGPFQARIDALTQAFRVWGWRSSVAPRIEQVREVPNGV